MPPFRWEDELPNPSVGSGTVAETAPHTRGRSGHGEWGDAPSINIRQARCQERPLREPLPTFRKRDTHEGCRQPQPGIWEERQMSHAEVVCPAEPDAESPRRILLVEDHEQTG